MTNKIADNSQFYDLHGIATFKVIGENDAVAQGLDKELSIFRVNEGSPDLSITFGCFPSNDWIPSGSSVDKNLFYDERTRATTVLWSTKSVVKRRHVRYIFLGDIKRPDDRISVFIPSTSISKQGRVNYWRNIPNELSKRNWSQAALYALRRESFYKFEAVDNATNEVLMLVIQPYLYYRLPLKGYSFVHGSAVSNSDGLGAIFFGTSNVGKTRVALQMAKQGMNFLGDDLAIIGRNGQGFSYPKRVRIEPQDTLLYPRLADLIRSGMDGRERFVFDFARRYLNRKSIDANVRVSIADLLPDTKIAKGFRLRTLIHVRRMIGSEPSLEDLDAESCVKMLTSELFWQFGTGGKQEYISCASYANGTFLEEEQSHYSRVMEIISKAVNGVSCFELQLPTQFDVTEVGKMIGKVALM